MFMSRNTRDTPSRSKRSKSSTSSFMERPNRSSLGTITAENSSLRRTSLFESGPGFGASESGTVEIGENVGELQALVVAVTANLISVKLGRAHVVARHRNAVVAGHHLISAHLFASLLSGGRTSRLAGAKGRAPGGTLPP
jgi:hypothetical protein